MLFTQVLSPHIRYCVTAFQCRAAAAIPSSPVSMTFATVSPLPTSFTNKNNFPVSSQMLLATSKVAIAPSYRSFAGIIELILHKITGSLLACSFHRSAHHLWHSMLVRNGIHVSEILEFIFSACSNASPLSPTSKDIRAKTNWCRVFCFEIPSCEIEQLHSNQSNAFLSRGKGGKKKLYSVYSCILGIQKRKER